MYKFLEYEQKSNKNFTTKWENSILLSDDFNNKDIEIILNWFKENVMSSKEKTLMDKTLLNVFLRASGVALSLTQVKNVMDLLGYSPLNYSDEYYKYNVTFGDSVKALKHGFTINQTVNDRVIRRREEKKVFKNKKGEFVRQHIYMSNSQKEEIENLAYEQDVFHNTLLCQGLQKMKDLKEVNFKNEVKTTYRACLSCTMTTDDRNLLVDLCKRFNCGISELAYYIIMRELGR